MSRIRMSGGISGFPRRSESEYDTFGTAHSSTSVSAALGMAQGAKLKGDTGDRKRHVVAVNGGGGMDAGLGFFGPTKAHGSGPHPACAPPANPIAHFSPG